MASELLRNLIKEQSTPLYLEARSKEDVIKEISLKISQVKKNLKEEEIFIGLSEREAKASTGVDLGVAIPHTSLTKIVDTELYFFLAPHGIEFSSLDSELSYLFFVILSPKNPKKPYISSLKIMADICRTMRIDRVRFKLKSAKSLPEVLQILEG
ncbi:PTS sugar transporter subunit IIA [Fluviispira vulneris]|uniref:PTS sugar transporter subunit IIA n=1 Tax=Fluviispira vulneris TaxID=2763012 RepID=UPI001645C865|nr:PTS sugar transporter subunit IIA [Fluviispira vulneris]